MEKCICNNRGSYLSNLADTDGMSDVLKNKPLNSLVDGWAAYLSCSGHNLFLDAEYMAALDDFQASELQNANGEGAEPGLWNLETGFNYNWGRNLEVAFKYAGSDEANALEIPESRYGMTFNQNVFEGTVFSVGYLHDEFETNMFDSSSEDSRNTLFSRVKIELKQSLLEELKSGSRRSITLSSAQRGLPGKKYII